MRAILVLLPGLLLSTSHTSSAGAAGEARPSVSSSELERVRQEVRARIARGADPVSDAAKAARRGDFRLIVLGQHGMLYPAGATCFTPYRQAPEALTRLQHSDFIDAEVSSWYRYASAYNRALIDHPLYPDAGLCRAAAEPNDQDYNRYYPVATAARQVSTPPATLHEAARRGGARDVRRLLASAGDIDALDGLDMTPLSWAVARDNRTAVDALLRAGASPWVSGVRGQDALFWAAQLGRRAYFERMERVPGRHGEWSPMHLAAAASGGNVAIIALMLEQPHSKFRLDMLLSPLPSAASLELILKREPGLADELLWEATDYPADRADLVELALRHGADPNHNGNGRYGTLLGAFANGISPASVKIVDMLLKAAADPNLISHRQRPVWLAVGGLTLGVRSPELKARATAIFQRLVEAGADLNLPNDQGVPPARVLLFPYRGTHDKLDASFVTPPLLEMLVRNGLDLNAPWQGKRILPLVEEQAGVDSELAMTLRRLGARP
jgi:ankyrin repeat protein